MRVSNQGKIQWSEERDHAWSQILKYTNVKSISIHEEGIGDFPTETWRFPTETSPYLNMNTLVSLSSYL